MTGSGLAEEAEGYLLAQSHRDQARREAEELCAQLPWLTTAEAEDLTTHFVRQRIDVSRRLLRGTVQRAAELREEYEARYAELRRALLRRHAAGACAVLACAASVSAVVCDLIG
ncbi:hypothetical protein ACFY3O_23760 [Streptomyces sp. NPDC001046]|uniref:hypothetical protein n=1 Tax=Streptomyces sp. NPDC001046 TaxID=3364543 RepID=UPI0036B0A193